MKRIAILLAWLAMSSCEYIEYHPYQTSVSGKTGINARNCEKITANCEGRSQIRFIFMTDTQRWYDQTLDAVKAINALDSIDFVIFGGDMSDFGLRKEFCLMRDIFEKLDVPYVSLIGNHDCIGTGEEVFRKIFGDTDFAFTAGDTRFICLNTNALEYDYSTDIPNMRFIESQVENMPSDIRRTVAVMHVRPMAEEFNNNLSRPFHMTLKRAVGLEFCLFGHEHKMIEQELFDDGIPYIGCTCIEDREFLLFDINRDGYEYRKVTF